MTTNEADPRDVLLQATLAEGLSYSRAAAAAGCSKATVARRMTDPAFRGRVMAARQEHAEEASARVEGLAARAADELESLLADESSIVRLKAVFGVLDRAEQRRVARETGDRLSKLEQSIALLLQERGLRSAA